MSFVDFIIQSLYYSYISILREVLLLWRNLVSIVQVTRHVQSFGEVAVDVVVWWVVRVFHVPELGQDLVPETLVELALTNR